MDEHQVDGLSVGDARTLLEALESVTVLDPACLFVYFYYRALQLLGPRGSLAFISSNKWLRAAYGARLRQVLKDQAYVRCVIDFGDLPVFEAASAYPMILIVERSATEVPVSYLRVRSLGTPYPDVDEPAGDPADAEVVRIICSDGLVNG